MNLQKPDITTENYISELAKINPKYDTKEIRKAFEIAKRLHKNQFRKSGEPYMVHPIEVSKILAGFGMDNETIVSGLLHDAVEDTEYTREQLIEDFNEDIALLVDGVTKLGNIKYDTKEKMQAENFRKMFLAMSKDIRVLVVKLADRLHNMRTLEYMPTHKIEEKALETLEIYAPLAGRLGIYSIKFEFEDLCLKYLHPKEYKELEHKVQARKEERGKIIEHLINEISDELEKSNIEFDVNGRSKHLYSIYKKMKLQHKQLDEIFDLVAIRIIVKNIKDCYGALGLVHTRWTPIPGRFKDYIAMPKPNMYQSIHTTVLDDNGEPFEIQIRTEEMHRVAEYGIAAHWKYKEGNTKSDAEDTEKKLSWLRQALEWQKETDDSLEFLETLKMDLFDNQVFVFTPRGDVIELPMNSTPLDFAFKIHTDIGIKCVGAKVNGKMVTIDHQLKNGDIVEIVTSANSSGPSIDWLNIVKSSQAKNKIRNWFRKLENGEGNINKGKTNIYSYIKRKGFDPALVAKNAYMIRAVKDFNFVNINELYNQISHGGGIISKLGQRLIEYYLNDSKEKQDSLIEKEEKLKNKKHIDNKKHEKTGVCVKGYDNLLIRLSRCCSPVPGDEIIGFITKGHGITVHRKDCTNIKSLSETDKERLIDVEWETPKEGQTYFADILIEGNDRKGMFGDISKVCEDMDVKLAGVNMKPVDAGYVKCIITVSISGMHQINKLLIGLRNIEGVERVYRTKG